MALRTGDKSGAFSAGVEALRSCFFGVSCADQQFLGNLKKWASDACRLDLDKGSVADFKSLHTAYTRLLEEGKEALESINR